MSFESREITHYCPSCDIAVQWRDDDGKPIKRARVCPSCEQADLKRYLEEEQDND